MDFLEDRAEVEPGETTRLAVCVVLYRSIYFAWLQVQPFLLLLTPLGRIHSSLDDDEPVTNYLVVIAGGDEPVAINCGSDGERALQTLFHTFWVSACDVRNLCLSTGVRSCKTNIDVSVSGFCECASSEFVCICFRFRRVRLFGVRSFVILYIVVILYSVSGLPSGVPEVHRQCVPAARARHERAVVRRALGFGQGGHERFHCVPEVREAFEVPLVHYVSTCAVHAV
jgi:hypothetical protein